MCCRAALRFLKRCWQFVAPRGSLSGSVLAVVLLASVTTVHAQVASQAIPNEQYYGGFAALNEGNFKLALEAFRGALSSGIRTGQQRWIDSICYYTMTGEVYYRMGMYAEAKDNFDAALNLVIAFPNWMMRVRFADSITPEAPGAIQGVPWGASRNGARFGHFPNNVQILMGRLDNESVIKQGGVVQPPSFNNISPQEIVRCTVLALYRRQSIMGPVAPYEPITDQVTAVLLQNIAQPNHWSQTWVDSMVGMSFASAGKSAQAVPILKRSLLLAGQYDHPLTSMAYLKLGQIAMETGDMANAMTYFDEATYSAAHFGNLGVLEEAFRGGQIAYLMSGQKGLYPPLVKATSWAKSRGSYLYTSLLLQEAESYAVLGDTQGTQAAVERLLEAKKQLTSRDMNKGEVGARYNLINGMVSYQKFLPAPGDEAIGAALGWAKAAGRADKSSVDHPGSKWLFQIGMADSLYTQGTVSPRVAAELYARLLRDPSPTDWGFDPLESLAVLSVPHVPAYEHWFEAAMQRKDIDTALEVADRTRRHRFLNTQQFGGRLLSLRWILESSPESLDKDAKLQRQDLLSRYPAYAKMSQTARDLFAQIRKSPLAPETNDAQREQAALLAELNKVSQQQEVTLREIAVRREGAAIVFPPLRSAKDIKAALPPKTLLLTFFSTNKQLYAFLISNTRYANWQFNSTAQLDKHCLGLLKSLGNFDKNRELSIAQLSDTSWKQQAKDALTAMLANSNVDLSKGVDELVIVPDSQMWYVPLEALQLGDGANQQSLIEKMRVRYAPTMGLTIPDQKGRAAAPVVAVTLGKLYPRDDAAVSQEAFDQLKKVVPGAMALKGQSWAPTPLLSTLYDGLIAIDDLDVKENDPFGWSPMPLDKLRQTGALSNWFPLPWGGPDIVILPGFHTAAEVGLKKSGGAAGNDMFLAIMGLMSTGSRTILISRWRTGGQTCHDLIRQFAQELPYETAATAWQRSVKSALDQPITPGLEPRVKDSTNVTPPKAEHPFLWSGYLLVDNGTPPQKQEVAPAAPPVLKFDPRLVKPGNPAAAPGAAPANPEKAEKLPEKADKPDEKAEKPDEKEKAGA